MEENTKQKENLIQKKSAIDKRDYLFLTLEIAAMLLLLGGSFNITAVAANDCYVRSEQRRVGKECRCG